MAAIRDERGRFVKGSVGNPRGKAKIPADAKAMLKDALPDAIACIIQHAQEGDEKCAMYICDRVLGKPTQPMDVDMQAEISAPMPLQMMLAAAREIIDDVHADGA